MFLYYHCEMKIDLKTDESSFCYNMRTHENYWLVYIRVLQRCAPYVIVAVVINLTLKTIIKQHDIPHVSELPLM